MADTSVPITAGIGTPVAVEVQNALDYQVVLPGAHLASPYTEAIINAALNGDNIIIAAPGALKVIRVYGFILFAQGGAVNAKWTDGVGGTSLFGPVFPFNGVGAAWQQNRDGNPWWTGTANTALILNLSGAVQVGGRIWYVAS